MSRSSSTHSQLFPHIQHFSYFLKTSCGFFPFLKLGILPHPLPSALSPSPLPFQASYKQICFKQLNSYFNSTNYISNCQSGFQILHSTFIKLLYLSDFVLRDFDKRFLASIITLDFFKTFDTADHELLLLKFEHYGLSSSAFSLIRSFLIDRIQVLLFNSHPIFSPALPSDVPQSYVLDPLLFIFSPLIYFLFPHSLNFLCILTMLSF